MHNTYWTKKLQSYSQEKWADLPSIFAETTLPYLTPKSAILELGAGLGQDSAYFASHDMRVTATDFISDHPQARTPIHLLDLNKPLPFTDGSFDVVYSHLALHYFTDTHTHKIFDEIWRVLKPNGILAFLVNSVHDPEIQEGSQIEPHFRRVGDIDKRFFDVEDVKKYTKKFTPLLCNDQGSTHKDIAKGVHNLVQYIGKKL